MAKVILIAGLPGSGKSTYGKKLKARLGAADYLDDYHANAIGDDPAFKRGRQYERLIAGLKNGETWIASDIESCRPQKRREVEATLQEDVPQVVIEWHFLATDEDTCRRNVEQRDPQSRDSASGKIDELVHEYLVPPWSKIVYWDNAGAQGDCAILGNSA